METKVRQLVKQAMIDKNENAKLTYKSILENALKLAKSDGNRSVTYDDFIKATKNEIKQLNDLYEFVKNDTVRATNITEKIGYCQELLPQAITKEQIIEYLTTNNIEKNIGVCMKTLKAQFGSNLDGKMAQGIVKEYISKQKGYYVKELINQAETICDTISDMPSGCDGCWLYDESEDFECPMHKTISRINKQIS